LATTAPSALVVADSRVDELLFPGLPPLPGAAVEARRVAALYNDVQLAVGPQATRDAFAAIGDRAVVHLALHATVNDAYPPGSALALTPRHEGDGSGALYAGEIAKLPRGRTRTVVLGACDGARGPAAGRDQGLSLARAFLAADIPTVVAALWPVGDQRSVELLTALHEGLRAGEDPATALRAAQLRLLAGSDRMLSSPATWALFQALGG
ncbi:MAG TPA: CHAT domain-containing protein, partial [Thermoanaerobaculia bacterium]|nr:CHAT domain-containing protein [Thermoanaerobaculia bacterium]